MVQSTVEKQKQKQELGKVVEQLKHIYDETKEKVVRVTSGSTMDEALRNYERREMVARDIRKDVVKRKAGDEEGKVKEIIKKTVEDLERL